VPTIRNRLIDLAERTAATFAQAFLAVLIADESGVTQLTALKVAAVAGGLAVAKYLLVYANAVLGNPPAK
jgi:Putative lactococcus lactis phage r1t holin